MMSSWDYRVVEHGAEGVGTWYELAEVYYNDDGEIDGWCGVSGPYGDDVADLTEDVNAMAFAVRRPILQIEDLDGTVKSMAMTSPRIRHLLSDRA
jgi:hypothetical protein